MLLFARRVSLCVSLPLFLAPQGFPTIKFFKGGKPTEYSGGRDKDSIVNWVRRKSGPSTVAITDAEKVSELAESHEVFFLAFVSAADSAAAAAVTSAADASEETVFAVVTGEGEAAAALRAKYEVPAGEAVISVNRFPGQANVVRYSGDLSAEDASASIAKWASANSLPLVVVFSQETARKIFAGDLKTHFLLFADVDEEAHSGAVTAFREAAAAEAAAHAGSPRALFVRVPLSEERVREYFGIGTGAEETPAAVLVHMGEEGMKKYKAAPGGASIDLASTSAFTAFLDSYEAGSLKAWLKSEAAPDAEENAAAAVKVITGNTFSSAVIDNEADVLLEVYAPWCGHCKQLAPTYEKLGEAVKAAGLSDKVVIAKMDGTANEVDYPGVNVKGFPTIFFFKSGEKASPIDFEGNRDLDGFISFIKSKAGNDVSALAAAAGDDEEEESDE